MSTPLPPPVLEIPLRDPISRQELGEVVTFDPLDLPAAEDVMEVLVDQEATQSRWLRFAAQYFRLRRTKDSEKILLRIKGDYNPIRTLQAQAKPGFNPDRVYALDPEGRAFVGNALAALYLHYAREARLGNRQTADKEGTQEKPVQILVQDGTAYRTESLSALQLLARAESLLAQAQAHTPSERVSSVTWVTKGELLLEQHFSRLNKGGALMSLQEADKALTLVLQAFSTSLELRPMGMRAMFGKASILFQKGSFKEAKEAYSRAIFRYPGADPGPTRVSLGLCYYEMGQDARAQECFERALELDPKCVDAHICLAILELGLATDAERVAGATPQEFAQNQENAKLLRERAHDRLRLAYDQDKWNPLLKVHLANYWFYKEDNDERDYKRVGDLAKEAFNHTTSKFIRAEACYISARNAHDRHQGVTDIKTSTSLYQKANEYWASFPLARFGQAQMELTQAKPDWSAALRTIIQVTETSEGKDDEDVLFMLGALHARGANVDAALKALRRVTEKNIYRADAWIEQALLEQQSYRMSPASAEEAVRCYEKAIEALKFGRKTVAYELHNNVGALNFRLGKYKESIAAYDEALKLKADATAMEVDQVGDEIRLDTITLLYNKARALEGLGEFKKAEKIYLDILSRSDDNKYVDASMRLAIMVAGRGDFEEAFERFLKPMSAAVDIDKNARADFNSVWAELETSRARLHPEMGNAPRVEAFKKLDRIIADCAKHDPYARLALANFQFEDAQSMAHQTKEEKDKKEKIISAALGVYRTVLKMHPKNAFAANGIGASLAIRGRYESAKQILEKVKDFSESICPSVFVNLGHVYIHEGAYDKAAALYDQCLKRFYDNRDPELGLLLANARFQAGKYSEAKSTLLNALRQNPMDENLWFAMATVEEMEGHQILNVDAEAKTSKVLQAGIASLNRCAEFYEWMIAKNTALTSENGAKKGAEEGQEVVESLAVKAFREAQLIGIPHRPVPPPARFNPLVPSAILKTRAKVAAKELIGQEPDAALVNVLRQADLKKFHSSKERAEALRLGGRRADVDRAVCWEKLHKYSKSAVGRLASLASKRMEIVNVETKRAQTLLEARKRLENKEIEKFSNVAMEAQRLRDQREKELAAAKPTEPVHAQAIAAVMAELKTRQPISLEEVEKPKRGKKSAAAKSDQSDEDEMMDEEAEEEEEEEVSEDEKAMRASISAALLDMAKKFGSKLLEKTTNQVKVMLLEVISTLEKKDMKFVKDCLSGYPEKFESGELPKIGSETEAEAAASETTANAANGEAAEPPRKRLKRVVGDDDDEEEEEVAKMEQGKPQPPGDVNVDDELFGAEDEDQLAADELIPANDDEDEL